MKVWVLERLDGPGWDENEGFVIVAPTPGSARKLAAEQASDEGQKVWLDAEHSTCKMITTKRARVVLRAFNAG